MSRTIKTRVALGMTAFLSVAAYLIAAGCATTSAPQTNSRTESVKGITFKDKLAGSGRTPEGFPFSFHRYESSDGIEIQTIAETYDSAERAIKEFRKKVAQATEVISTDARRNTRGAILSERTVAIVDSHSTPRLTVIFLVEGKRFWQIQSPSLKHLIEFERQFPN